MQLGHAARPLLFTTAVVALLSGILLLLSLFSPSLQAAEITDTASIQNLEQLNIITSFPPEFYTPFLEAFSDKYPNIQISILNKKTTAAIDEILRGNQRNFDLFWSSSADAFDVLQSAHLLIHSEQQHAYPLASIKNRPLIAPGGYFHSFALSGVGWMWNSLYLKKERLPVPNSWTDLTKPVYYGHIAMSTPSRSGTNHLIVENFLQKFGWEKGWAQLLLMSGNFATVTARSFSVPEGVTSGRFSIGLVIDFLAHCDKAKNIYFKYGKPVFLVSAAIAPLKNYQNLTTAELFLQFILSTEGQKLLLRPEINRIPIAQNLLSQSPREVAKLIEIGAQDQLRTYNVHLSRQRYQLVNQLFDRMITFKLRERRHIWKQTIDLAARYGKKDATVIRAQKQVISLLGQVPVSAEQSQSREFLTILTPPKSGAPASVKQREVINHWDTFIDEKLGQARKLLYTAEESLAKRKGTQ